MKRSALAFVIIGLLASAAAASADNLPSRSNGTADVPSKLEPAVMLQALAAARTWAQDQSLILYCLRRHPNRDMLAHAIADDRDKALAGLRHAGGSEQQVRQVADVIAANYRLAEPSADDKPLTDACTAKDVERNVEILGAIAWPLWMRPPFKDMR